MEDLTYYIIYLIAFATSASAFSFNSIVWLRVLSAISSFCYVLYYFLFPSEPLWLDIITEGSLIIINVFMLFSASYKKSKVKFTEDEEEIFAAYFSRFSAFQFFKLMRIAIWEDFKTNDLLIEKGKTVEHLYFIYNGTALVQLNSNKNIPLEDGAFIGELSFSLSAPATADVRILNPSRIVCWNQTELKSLLKRNPRLKTHLNTLITEDLAHKLS